VQISRLSRVVNIGDLREMARRRLPRMAFDYIDGGAESERTMNENCRAFDDVVFRPRSGVVHPHVDLQTTVLGHEIAFPAILAPVGSSRMFWPRGEARAAAAAGRAGTIYTLSTLSGTPIEEVKSAALGPCWFQLYLCGGRDVASKAIERAKAAGYSALVITIDTPVSGMRERDFRNGIKELLTFRPLTMAPFIGQMLVRPRWVASFFADGGLMQFPNVVLPSGPMGYADVAAALESAAVRWEDFAWLREAWRGPLVVKGVHTGDDARHAIDLGADAVVVSNHGGRQLDGVAPTLRVLPEVIRAADGNAEVLVDGGIRRGADIAKALAIGARAVLIGRAYAYGLAASGEAGVSRALEILRSDLLRTLKLLGCPSARALDRSFVSLPQAWSTD
jgi:isopentenyl diphosphate isomerase/L-lactate dehydrogenase-like FMN-dependent dehydrogenase